MAKRPPRLIAHTFLGVTGHTVGMTCTDGIYVGSRRIDTGDCSGPKSARLVLNNPAVETAVLETARGGILREGLAFDKCDVAVVTKHRRRGPPRSGRYRHARKTGPCEAGDCGRCPSTGARF
ncbi:MAG: hypothetical protein U0894_11170 [Pirellulales bacterium]